MLYRGVFRAGETYHPGDTVTWGGSLWHCNSMTGDKPGEAHSSAWTLAANVGGMQEAEMTALLTLEESRHICVFDHDADDEC
ncbi:putative portal protein [Escherichia coli]|nr:putative portal protein [Escherichia coli]